MLYLAYSYLHNKEDAEDIVHDVFLFVACRHISLLKSFKDEKEVRNYLLKAIKNKLDNNKDWRKEDKPNAKGNNEARNRYLSSLGINIEAYDENDTDNMIDPNMIIKLIKEIVDKK